MFFEAPSIEQLGSSVEQSLEKLYGPEFDAMSEDEKTKRLEAGAQDMADEIAELRVDINEVRQNLGKHVQESSEIDVRDRSPEWRKKLNGGDINEMLRAGLQAADTKESGQVVEAEQAHYDQQITKLEQRITRMQNHPEREARIRALSRLSLEKQGLA